MAKHRRMAFMHADLVGAVAATPDHVCNKRKTYVKEPP
jgi:hypothetical protein